jgi:hypothetical protein
LGGTATTRKHRRAETLKAKGMWDQICLSDISEESWRAAINALTATGWSVRKGGGWDFSWAVLDRDGMRIDMEYDVWREGEMAFAKADASTIKADLPAQLIVELKIE